MDALCRVDPSVFSSSGGTAVTAVPKVPSLSATEPPVQSVQRFRDNLTLYVRCAAYYPSMSEL